MKPLVSILAVWSSVAFAQGAVLTKEQLPDALRTTLAAQVAKARRADEKPFRAVQAVRAKVLDLDRAKRGRVAPISPILEHVPNALWALVDVVALDGQLPADAPASAVLAWQVGALEALGALRAPAAEPVLLQVVAVDGLPLPVTRAAAEALGKLGTDRAVAALLERARRGGDAGRAVELGLGDCRRQAVAEHLERAVNRAGEPAEQRALLVRALSRLASSWVLAMPKALPVPAEASALRAAAARGLVQTWLGSDAALRQQAEDALRIIDAPETLVLLDARRAVDPAGVDALKATLSRR